ncbi:ComEA family DNA-binding protein [Microbulbifer sp.]|uniref:ComEA family DNA-binding protein n=1 Tax=Microbulbifer sp. TaxID=1908541 RepID=UPI0025863335|nr:ComEA family DNA-binding protein [Microbulbifer sp.]
MKVIKTTLVAVLATLLLGTATVYAAEETTAESSAQASVEMQSVNVNTATAAQLAEALDGVGEARAELIIQYREEKGGFSSVEELLEIKGIGMATLEKNRERIQL